MQVVRERVGVQVVFSEAYWVGTKAENPEEHKLPMPLSLIEAGKKAQGAESSFTRLDCMQDEDQSSQQL